jgi:hypothetical protein
MTRRDRMVVGCVLAVGLVGLLWMFALGPKRKEAAKLGDDVAAQRQRLDTARAAVTASRAAQQRFGSDYATVVRLGKAVPEDDDVPSLVYQLDSAAGATGVDFRKLSLTQDSAASAATPAGGSGSGSSGSGSGSGSSAGSGSSRSGSGSGSSAGSGSSSSGSATSGSSGAGTGAPASPSTSPSATAAGSAPATEAAAATLPPGSAIGPAGFPTMPFSFVFEGSFFKLSGFLRKLDRFVVERGNALSVTGRLLTIDGLNLSPGDEGFPAIKATIAARAYLVPGDQDLSGGATPQAPAATTSTSTSP